MIITLKNTEYFINLEEKYGAHNYHPLPVVLSKAEGVWVWDVNGRKYLDCLSAYSAVNHGHRHPKIIKALKEQLGKLTLTSRAFYNDKLGIFLEKLCNFTGFEKALPMNTGAEAVETGIKIARRWGYYRKNVKDNKAEIIVCEGNFHGRTTTIVGFSSDPVSRDGFGPATPGFKRIPFNDPNALDEAVTENTVAFLVEPIQGERGVIIPDKGYLRAVRKICNKYNILLILDEIQTGFGRTGRKFAFMHEDIRPDILLVGKALGGGVYPVSAALTDSEIMDVITPGSHGSTFGGNPLAAAVGIASIKVLEEEGLVLNSAKLGSYFLTKLKDKIGHLPFIKDIRGKGLFIAIEFKPLKNYVARLFAESLLEKGILAKDTHGTVIRLAPPLVIDRETVDWAADRIEECAYGFELSG